MKLKLTAIYYPFLFGLFPVLFLYTNNINEVPFIDILPPAVVIIVGIALVFFILKLLTKDYGKSGLITSLLVILFFAYGHVSSYATAAFGLVKGTLILGILWITIFAIGIVFTVRSKSDLKLLHSVLNVIGVSLLCISLINIGIRALQDIGPENDTLRDVETESFATFGSTAQATGANYPDIYYIIIDSYAGKSTLEDIFKYDNSKFLSSLETMGFYVAEDANSNYSQTNISLSSSLNMDYIDNLVPEKIMENNDYTVLIDLIADNQLLQFLKDKGYYCTFISDGFFGKGVKGYDKVCLPGNGAFGLGMTNFAVALIQTTALEPFRMIIGADARNDMLYVFNTLKETPNVPSPKFTFIHSIGMHTPFVFDSTGDSVIGTALYAADEMNYYQKGYIEQLVYLNQLIEDTIEIILEISESPPVIILQSDHGSSATIKVGDTIEDLTQDQFNERMGILNAYFFPDKDYSSVYESVSPVNSFRLVLNRFFGTDLQILEDKSYYSLLERPFEFTSFD